MLAVINQDGFFVAYLHQPEESDMQRPDTVETDEENLSTGHQYVDGNWIAPEPPPRDPEAAPPRGT